MDGELPNYEARILLDDLLTVQDNEIYDWQLDNISDEVKAEYADYILNVGTLDDNIKMLIHERTNEGLQTNLGIDDTKSMQYTALHDKLTTEYLNKVQELRRTNIDGSMTHTEIQKLALAYIESKVRDADWVTENSLTDLEQFKALNNIGDYDEAYNLLESQNDDLAKLYVQAAQEGADGGWQTKVLT